MYVCLYLCLSLFGREVTVGYARLRGSMGATFCHLGALWSAIEFLFWDHGETAVLVQNLAGRSREVTGGHGRLREVTGGYGRLRRGKTEESGGTAGNRLKNKTKENEGKSSKAKGKWRKMEELRSSRQSSVRWGSEQDSLQRDEK